MSSDVYLEFTAPDNMKTTPDGWEQTVRIGNLGLMNYFGFDLLGALRTLRTASRGKVTPWLPEAAEALTEAFQAAMKEDMEKPEDWWATVFGYCKPSDLTDTPQPKKLLSIFKEFQGWAWETRVD